MNDLQKGIYQIVVQEIKKAMPKKEENLLSKQDAEKIIKKIYINGIFNCYGCG